MPLGSRPCRTLAAPGRPPAQVRGPGPTRVSPARRSGPALQGHAHQQDPPLVGRVRAAHKRLRCPGRPGSCDFESLLLLLRGPAVTHAGTARPSAPELGMPAPAPGGSGLSGPHPGLLCSLHPPWCPPLSLRGNRGQSCLQSRRDRRASRPALGPSLSGSAGDPRQASDGVPAPWVGG